MLTDMALPYRTYICRCVMSPYPRRLLVVYLSVKVMRRPLLMNKRQRSALFVYVCAVMYLTSQKATLQPSISKSTRKRLENDTKKKAANERRKSRKWAETKCSQGGTVSRPHQREKTGGAPTHRDGQFGTNCLYKQCPVRCAPATCRG